jgi:hypothetical protein
MGKTSLILEYSLSQLTYFISPQCILLVYIASYCFKVMNVTNVRNVSSLEFFVHVCALTAAVK